MRKFWKLLNRAIFLTIFFIPIFLQLSLADVKDIWKQSQNIKKIESKPDTEFNSQQELPLTTINPTSQQQLGTSGIQEVKIKKETNEIIFGIYDPATTGIPVNFWSGIDSKLFQGLSSDLLSDPNSFATNYTIKKIFFSKVNLSEFDDKGISYLNFISLFLAKQKDIDLIDLVINQNNLLLNNEKLLNYLINDNFASYEINKTCKYATQLGAEISNFELQKFKVFCLVQAKENRKALAQLELMKEAGFKDSFFVQKINYLQGMLLSKKGIQNTDSLLNIHLSILSDPEYNPSYSFFKNNLNKKKYFFKSPLVEKVVDKNNTLESGYTTEDEFELIKFLESGSDANIFPIDKLLPFYKKIIFGIDDLLSPLETYSKYHPSKGRALLYQAILLTRDPEQKLAFMLELKKNYIQNKTPALANALYFQLVKNINKKYLSKDLLIEIQTYNENINKKISSVETNNAYLHTSDAISLLADKKINKKKVKILNKFSKLVAKNKYQLNKKDLAMIYLLSEKKISLPGELKKSLNSEEIYIPNKIYNLLEKNQLDLATIELLKLIKSLKESKDYVRDFRIINKIFDRLGFDLLKNDFNKYELLVS
ncbi:hypothetical protein OAM44_02230 [Pelagibacteraceae bacterium]|nr:hypothetical protein [Pelagibacteraceae bacterium]